MQSEGSDQYRDQAAINFTPSQAATPYAGSMSRTGKRQMSRDDDDKSKASFYTSYTEATDGDGLVKKEGNRAFNTLSETYSLPTDVNEWERLDKQHRAITLGLGGLYPAPDVVRAILAPQERVKKRIVDLGCGTGIWSTEMAREFPHCDILGIDLAPVPIPPENLPPNCRFEMNDISLGLSHLKDQFHVVFARLMGLGLKDFRKSLADAQECLKAGGILIWIDGDADIYSGWPMVYPPVWSTSNPDGSYTRRVLYEVRRSAPGDLRTMEKIIDEGFWNHATMLDPETCKAASLSLPIGIWCEAGNDPSQKEQIKYLGSLMRQNFIEGSRTMQLFLLKVGWSQAMTDRWAAGMRDESQNDTLGLRYRLAWGRRREGPDLPAPVLPRIPSSATSEVPMKSPLYEVYDTPEQAFAAAASRNEGKVFPEPPPASASTE